MYVHMCIQYVYVCMHMRTCMHVYVYMSPRVWMWGQHVTQGSWWEGVRQGSLGGIGCHGCIGTHWLDSRQQSLFRFCRWFRGFCAFKPFSCCHILMCWPAARRPRSDLGQLDTRARLCQVLGRPCWATDILLQLRLFRRHAKARGAREAERTV